MNSTSWKSEAWKTLLLLLGTGIACLALGESLVRIAYGRPAFVAAIGSGGRDVQSDFDVTYGVTPDGSRRVTCDDVEEAGFATVSIIGDSFAFGQGVDDAETFSHLLDCSSTKLDVVNYGQIGIGIDEYRQIAAQILTLSSDVIVLLFYGNDVTMEVNQSLLRRTYLGVCSESSLCELLRRIKRQFVLKSALARQTGEQEHQVPNNPRSVLREVPEYISEIVDSSPAQIALFEQGFTTLISGIRLEHPQARIITAMVPEGGVISVELRSWYRECGAKALPAIGDPGSNYRRVEALSRAAKVEYVDLFSHFEGHGEFYFPRDFHLNSRGHRALFEVLAASIREAH